MSNVVRFPRSNPEIVAHTANKAMRLAGRRVFIEVKSGTRIVGSIETVNETHVILDTGIVSLDSIAILTECNF